MKRSAESLKARYRFLWAVPAGFLAVLLLWLGRSLLTLEPEERVMGYPILLYSLTLMNAIFIPVMDAVIASRLCDMEIKGNTLKLLFTLEKPGVFYTVKYLSCFRYLVVFTAGETLAMFLFGTVLSFAPLPDPAVLLFHFLSITVVGAVILGIQQLLSLLCENQILPLIVGLGGTFLGLFSMFFPRRINLLVLWGYFSIFSQGSVRPLGEDWVYEYVEFPLEQFCVFSAAAVLFFLLELLIFKKKKEV